MSEGYSKGPHTVYNIQCHFVWVTKNRYHIPKADVGLRARELIGQTCEVRSITILGGHVSKDHVHLHASCPSELAPSKIAQYL